MALMLGQVKMSPSDFWAMSWREFEAILKGLGAESGYVPPPSKEEREDLTRRANEMLRKQGKL